MDINIIAKSDGQKLGYTEDHVRQIMQYVMGTLTLSNAPHINRESLKEKGMLDEDIAKIEKTLPTVFELLLILFMENTIKQ